MTSLYLEAVEQDELADLHGQFGQAPLQQHEMTVDSPFLDGKNQLLTSRGRRGEICYVMHRGDPHEGVLLHRKVFYPETGYRLPTGGIHQGERVLETLVREIEEETSFQLRLPVVEEPEDGGRGVPVVLEAFLGTLVYRLYHRSQDRIHTFATYHFLVAAPPGAVPRTLDPEEKVADWQWRSAGDLAQVAETLAGVGKTALDWRDWGRFRALSHDFVAEQRPQRSSASETLLDGDSG